MQMGIQEGPLEKPANLANLAKMANWSNSPTTWRPMQMRRQEGPLGKPANLANLAKMAIWSKSPTTSKPVQMKDKRAPLESRREFGEFGENGKFVKIADNLQANANEKRRAAP